MDPYIRNRWLLSGVFSVVIILAAIFLQGALQVIAVIGIAILYYMVTRNYRPR